MTNISKAKILFVVTSHDKLGDTGEKTGFWVEELVAPYYTLADAGAEITLSSPKGGQAPIDPKSETADFQTESTKRYDKDESLQKAVASTKKLSDVKAEDYDAVFYPGGHGPMWDLVKDEHSIALIEAFEAAGKPIAAVCHAPAALLKAKTPAGKPLVEGKEVTGFTNTEEEGVQLTDVVPFLLEDELKTFGAKYMKANDWEPYVLRDGMLITGQNPASSEGVAKKLLEILVAAN